jgi:hypothetical protein
MATSNVASQEELKKWKIPLEWRDQCSAWVDWLWEGSKMVLKDYHVARLLIPLNRCRHVTNYAPWSECTQISTHYESWPWVLGFRMYHREVGNHSLQIISPDVSPCPLYVIQAWVWEVRALISFHLWNKHLHYLRCQYDEWVSNFGHRFSVFIKFEPVVTSAGWKLWNSWNLNNFKTNKAEAGMYRIKECCQIEVSY